MADSVLCQTCGIEAPLKYVTFNSNIGMLVARRHMTTRGFFCRRCIQKHFWKHTLRNVTLGWWGMISLIVTPIFIIGNIGTYITSFQLPPPAPDAAPPSLDEASRKRLLPVGDELMSRLSQKQALSDVAADLATRARVTPGQVVVYARELAGKPRPMVPNARIAPAAQTPIAAPVATPVATPITEPIPSQPPQPPTDDPPGGLGIT